MGYTPPEPSFRANLDRHGMPRDYATYVWLLYGKRVEDGSPVRRGFLNLPLVTPPDPGMRVTR